VTTESTTDTDQQRQPWWRRQYDRVDSFQREWSALAAARRQWKAQAKAERDPHFWLLTVPGVATILAGIVEWYWAMLFCIEATGRAEWSWETAAGNTGAERVDQWSFAFSSRSLWVLIGLVCATAPIVMWSMAWLPVSMKAEGSGRWRRGTMIATGILANLLVIISGTVVMNYNRQEQVRDALVIEQTAAQGRAAIQAQIDALDQELARLGDKRINNEYAAIAANVGVAAYDSDYLSPEAMRRSPPERRDILIRARGAAVRGDAIREQKLQLVANLAAAAPEAATAANVEDRVGVGLNTFAQYAEVYRPPFVALLCTLVGIFGAWWWVALSERINARIAVPIDGVGDDHMIEDLRDEPAYQPEPMRAAEPKMFDADTGEELVHVKAHIKRKGKKTRVEDRPAPLPDERRVESPSDMRERPGDAEEQPKDDARDGREPEAHEGQEGPEESIEALSDEDLLAAYGEEGDTEDQAAEPVAETAVEGAPQLPAPDETELPDGEGVMKTGTEG
jgi:hypothetical protein